MDRLDYQQQLEDQERQEREEFKHDPAYLAECKRRSENIRLWQEWAQGDQKWP